MRLRKLLITLILFIQVCPLHAAPVPNFPIQTWAVWMRYVQQIAAHETYFDITTKAGLIAAGLVTIPPTPPNPKYPTYTKPFILPRGSTFSPLLTGQVLFFDSNTVAGPDPRLAHANPTITNQDRLLIVQFYAARYGLLPIDDIQLSYFTPNSIIGAPPGPPSGIAASLGTTGANRINAIVGTVRYQLYKEKMGFLYPKILEDEDAAGARNPSRDAAIVLAGAYVEENYRLQIKLLDLMFTDSPLWQILLLDKGLL